MSFLPADIEKYNEDLDGWTGGTYKDVINEMNALGIQHRDYSKSPVPLQRALTTRQRKQEGVTNRISFQFPRHGVFVHKGVSKGHGKGNPRQAKEFLQPPVDRNFDKLGDIVLDGTGNMIINALLIR